MLSAKPQPAVANKHVSGHVTIGNEKRNGFGHVIRLANASNRCIGSNFTKRCIFFGPGAESPTKGYR